MEEFFIMPMGSLVPINNGDANAELTPATGINTADAGNAHIQNGGSSPKMNMECVGPQENQSEAGVKLGPISSQSSETNNIVVKPVVLHMENPRDSSANDVLLPPSESAIWHTNYVTTIAVVYPTAIEIAKERASFGNDVVSDVVESSTHYANGTTINHELPGATKAQKGLEIHSVAYDKTNVEHAAEGKENNLSFFSTIRDENKDGGKNALQETGEKIVGCDIEILVPLKKERFFMIYSLIALPLPRSAEWHTKYVTTLAIVYPNALDIAEKRASFANNVVPVAIESSTYSTDDTKIKRKKSKKDKKDRKRKRKHSDSERHENVKRAAKESKNNSSTTGDQNHDVARIQSGETAPEMNKESLTHHEKKPANSVIPDVLENSAHHAERTANGREESEVTGTRKRNRTSSESDDNMNGKRAAKGRNDNLSFIFTTGDGDEAADEVEQPELNLEWLAPRERQEGENYNEEQNEESGEEAMELDDEVDEDQNDVNPVGPDDEYGFIFQMSSQELYDYTINIPESKSRAFRFLDVSNLDTYLEMKQAEEPLLDDIILELLLNERYQRSTIDGLFEKLISTYQFKITIGEVYEIYVDRLDKMIAARYIKKIAGITRNTKIYCEIDENNRHLFANKGATGRVKVVISSDPAAAVEAPAVNPIEEQAAAAAMEASLQRRDGRGFIYLG